MDRFGRPSETDLCWCRTSLKHPSLRSLATCSASRHTGAMIDLYPAYKPFRNYMRRFAVVPSLMQLWGYFLYVSEGQRLPERLGLGVPQSFNIRERVYPWDLEILVREIILNAGPHGSDGLHLWNKLTEGINHVRRLEGMPYGDGPERADVMIDLQRIAHRQFRWQSGSTKRSAQIVRALKIFGGAELDIKVQEQTGMDMTRLLQLGMAVGGRLLRRPVLQLDADYSALGIPIEVSHAFLERLALDLPTIRDCTRECQQYNDAWLYASFPLEHYPLIRVDPTRSNHVLCPVPRYLMNRVSSGVFYDIVNADGFANAYGDAFQRYIGEVIEKVLPSPRFNVLEEEPYSPTKATLKHGTDWVVSDGTGHLFIECKTKRLSLGAKNVTDEAAVAKDLAAMSQAVVQTYKNIRDAVDGLTTWRPDGQAIYPLIVTLEDWHLFSTRFTSRLYEEIREALTAADINADIVDEMPYSIASASELETLLQVVAASSIGAVFSLKTHEDYRHWGWVGFLPSKFEDQYAQATALLFPEDVQRLLGDPTHSQEQ